MKSIEYYSACSKFIFKKDVNGLVHFIKTTPLPNKFYDSEYTFDYPLMLAVEEKNIEIIKALLELGADPNVSEEVPGDDYAGSQEIYSILYRHPDSPEFEPMLKMLCENGLDIDKAMRWAVMENKLQLMDLMKKYNPGYKEGNKSLWLTKAVIWNNVPAAQWLLNEGADPDWKGEDGSAREMALASKDKEIKSFFKKLGKK